MEASGTSGPSKSEMLQKLRQFAQVNPWVTKFVANPRLIAMRGQGHHGAKDTPPVRLMNSGKRPVSPLAAPVSKLDV